MDKPEQKEYIMACQITESTKMPYDVRALANFTLDFAESKSLSISNVTINKIIFFLHAWYLAKTGKPLVTAKVEAWEYGPVFRELYSEFKHFGKAAITIRAHRRNPTTAQKEVCREEIAESDVVFLAPLLDRYIQLSAGQLIELSHVPGGPWDQVYNHESRSNPGMQISNDLIRKYFEQQTRH
jgi:uncharacterized phage-associated protein